MLIKAITLFRLRAVSDFLFAFFFLWLHWWSKRQSVTLRQYIDTSDFLPTVLVHLRHKRCLSEYSRSRPFGHILCVFDRLDAPEAQSVICLSVLEHAPPLLRHARTRAHTHTHTFQPGKQRLLCGLYFQRFIIKHVPQFSNSKDSILQQSPIELILTLSLGFREERMRAAVKGRKLC